MVYTGRDPGRLPFHLYFGTNRRRGRGRPRWGFFPVLLSHPYTPVFSLNVCGCYRCAPLVTVIRKGYFTLWGGSRGFRWTQSSPRNLILGSPDSRLGPLRGLSDKHSYGVRERLDTSLSNVSPDTRVDFRPTTTISTTTICTRVDIVPTTEL